MFKVFALLFRDGNWTVVESEVTASKADARTAARRLRRTHKVSRPLVLTYPANEVPVYISF